MGPFELVLVEVKLLGCLWHLAKMGERIAHVHTCAFFLHNKPWMGLDLCSFQRVYKTECSCGSLYSR